MARRIVVARLRDTPEAPERLLGQLRRLQVGIRTLSLRRRGRGRLVARVRVQGPEVRMRRIEAELAGLVDVLAVRVCGPRERSSEARRPPVAPSTESLPTPSRRSEPWT